MQFFLQLILVVSATVQFSFSDIVYVQDAMSYTDARYHCEGKQMRLACITLSDINMVDYFPADIKDIWINTYLTFSSWIFEKETLHSFPNGTKFIVPSGDIFTCQILCSTDVYFVVQAENCICLSSADDLSLDATSGVTLYKSGSLIELAVFNPNTNPNINPDINCQYVCPEMSGNFTKPAVISDDCFGENNVIEICSPNNNDVDTCILFSEYYAEKRHLLRNLTCRPYIVECSKRNCNDNFVKTAFLIDRFIKKGVGLTSSINQHDYSNIKNHILSCYRGSVRMNSSIETMVFSEVTDCDSNRTFFCTTNTEVNGYCDLKPFFTGRVINNKTSIELTTVQGDHTATVTSDKDLTSVQGDGTTTEASTKMDLTTSEINYTPRGESTDSHQTSDKGVMVGLIVGICLFMFVMAGVFILIYCMRIKHKKLKQNQSNIFAIRNVAYESDSSYITNNINERNANRSDYDHIKEQEYATIEPDTDEKYQSIAAPLSHHNKALFSKPRLKKKQDSAYSSINKSETENVYDELKDKNNTNTQESEKDRPRIAYGKTHKNCLILENDSNRCSMHCDKTSKTNTNEYMEAGIVTNNFQHHKLQPQVNHDYLMLESKSSNVETDEGNKTSQYIPENYFMLQKFDTALTNNQAEEFDKEGDYVDSPECDYDHLHKKKQRKSQENEHLNLYSHLGSDSENENTYDTSRSFQTGPHIDSNAYDTMSNVKAGITDA